MAKPSLVYLKNKISSEFEYNSDVVDLVHIDNLYQITFSNGKCYKYGYDRVKYYQYISTREDVRIYEKGILNNKYNRVHDYERYFIFANEHSESYPIEKNSDIEICDLKNDTARYKSVIGYFKDILSKSGGIAFDIQTENGEDRNPNQISSSLLLKALDKIDVSESRSALSNYLEGTNPSLGESEEVLIYPFGCNESQKLAVETAFHSSISIVEGPPGTGKTQTILNIIANLIVQNKSVAIVSNNNSAVFNISEKLQKCGYDMLVASLGSRKNRDSFFDNIKKQNIDKEFELSADKMSEAKDEIRDLNGILTQCFQYRNRLASLKTKLSDTELEFDHVKSEHPISLNVRTIIDKKFLRKWDYSRSLRLKEFLLQIGCDKLAIINRLRLVFQYGLFDIRIIDTYKDELNVYLNYKFYELYIYKIKDEITSIEKWLKENNEESNLNRLIETSKKIFNAVLYKKYHNIDDGKFTPENYRKHFDDFIKHYPVILSSTLSLNISIPDGYLFDYLIIDEASQVDIIKSAVCFSCCRNAVVVGDSMQLTHIVDKKDKEIAGQVLGNYNINPAYDYVEKNILSSLKSLYGDDIRSVLLKEHYRCHPTIIGFCNKKYYENELVIMTGYDNMPFRVIETNISGCNGRHNQRQIDETVGYINRKYSDDYSKVGVIAPYREHADILQRLLPDGAEADTIHKYQGREKDVIIFNTVVNQIGEFIDNPNLINVAVSRAIREFVIVKPESMALPHGTNIGDLIRYIYYTSSAEEIVVKGQISSVFDLLYKEYNKMFMNFIESNHDIKGSAAEIIMHKLLRDEILLPDTQFASIDMTREYKLRDLISNYDLFSDEERSFIRNNARLDFLLYNRIDKTPILAIEVDGVSFHDNELQRKRDGMKDHILEIVGLPLLRLSTDSCDEKVRIVEALRRGIGID